MCDTIVCMFPVSIKKFFVYTSISLALLFCKVLTTAYDIFVVTIDVHLCIRCLVRFLQP